MSFGVLGLGAGALIAFMGMGMVLTYRGSGIINFAIGSIGMYVAYVYYGLRSSGVYLIPIPGVGSNFSTTTTRTAMGVAPAMALSVLTAVVLGLIIHFAVMRPLRNAPILAKVVATIGILLVLQSIVALKFGTATVSAKPLLPSFTLFSIDSTIIPANRMILAGVAVIVAIGLGALFRFSSFGISTRAAAENEKGAILLGVSPQFHAATTWVIACVLAGLVAILVAPITTLSPTQFSLLIIPALAAALLGRLNSFGITVATGLGIGALQGILILLPSRFSWFPQSGGPDAIPLIAIIIAMFAVGKSLPMRGAAVDAKLPPVPGTSRRSLVWLGGVVAILVVLLVTVNAGYRLAEINTITGAVLCLSLVVLTGFVGQLSLFQMALAGTSAFLLAQLATHVGVPFPFSMILASLGAMAVGLVGAIPALRVRGVNLAIVTLAAGAAIEALYFNNAKYTGGIFGSRVSGPILFGLDLRFSKGATSARVPFAIFALVVLFLVAAGVINLRRSQTGRRMLAVRANERAAAATGVDVRLTKLVAFGLSAFIAGLAGSLIAFQQVAVGGASFTALLSLGILAVAYLGGITSVSGGMIGGVLATGGLAFFFLQENVLSHLSNGAQLENTIGGMGLILTAIFNQAGIAGEFRKNWQHVAAKFAPRRAAGDAAVAVAAVSAASDTSGRRRIVAGTGLAGPILRTRGLSVTFGGVRAVVGVDLTVDEGTIVGLIGPNGAGKTTFIDAVSGFVTTADGTVELGGTRIDRLAPHARAKLGLARTFQSVELFDDLTVRENLQIASEQPRWWAPLADAVVPERHAKSDVVDQALRMLGVERFADVSPEDVSLGDKKLIGVARALAAGPRLLLLDEPGAGLGVDETRVLAEQLRRVRAAGPAILLVDHDMGLVLDVCDYVYVLEFGEIIAAGTPAEVRRDDRVIAAYLGDEGAEIPIGTEEPALSGGEGVVTR